MKKRVLWLGVVLLMFSVMPAMANWVGNDALIKIDCTGVTMTYPIENLQSGHSVTINYTLRYTVNGVLQDPPVTKTAIITAPLGTNMVPVFVSWSALGQANLCGKNVALIFGVGATSDVSYYDWSNDEVPTGTGESTFQPDPTGSTSYVAADCPCTSGPGICRTPGYWGTHTNVVSMLLVDPHFPSVCGQTVKTWLTSYINSSEELICVEPRGNQKLQLARQLMSTALNCLMDNTPATCGATFTECDAICVAGTDAAGIASCIDKLDCWNNGGTYENGFCNMGACQLSGLTCDSDDFCGEGDVCVLPQGSCHAAPIPSWIGDLPANSANDCTAAKKNGCTILGGCGVYTPPKR